jgi:hypothetical protein
MPPTNATIRCYSKTLVPSTTGDGVSIQFQIVGTQPGMSAVNIGLTILNSDDSYEIGTNYNLAITAVV